MAQQERYLQCLVYDKTQHLVGIVANPVSLSASDRYLALGSGELVVNANDDVVPALLADGARVAISVIEPDPIGNQSPVNAAGNNAAAKQTFMSGRLMQRSGDFGANGLLTFQIEDDWRVTRNSLTRVVPTGNVKATSLTDLAQSWAAVAPSAGTVDGAFGRYQWPYVGAVPAETAVRSLIQSEIVTPWNARFGYSYFPENGDLGLGSDVHSILPQARFGTVEDYIVPLLMAGGLSMRVAQFLLRGPANPAWMIFDIFQPKTWTQLLTPESGVVAGGTWSENPATVMDVIVGGPGDEAARAFRSIHGTGLIAQYGDWISAFRDATGAPMPWPSTLATNLQVAMYYHLRPEVAPSDIAAFEQFLADAGNSAFADGAATAGVSLELNETEVFRWGGDDGFHTGDMVTVAPSQKTQARDLRFTERITQTTITQSLDSGFTVTPTVGTFTDDPDQQLVDFVAQLAYLNRRKITNQ
jgi:hypothetical protein